MNTEALIRLLEDLNGRYGIKKKITEQAGRKGRNWFSRAIARKDPDAIKAAIEVLEEEKKREMEIKSRLEALPC